MTRDQTRLHASGLSGARAGETAELQGMTARRRSAGCARESCDRPAGEEAAEKRMCFLPSQNECDIGTGRDLTREGRVRSKR